MAVFICYNIELGPTFPVERSFADTVIGHMFGYQQVIIDPLGEFPMLTDQTPLVLRSIEEALQHPWLSKLRWVCLHAQGKITLQEYEHPEDDVIYYIGSDSTGLGFDPFAMKNADVVRIAAPSPDEENRVREFHALHLIPIIAYDRALKIWQKQNITKL